MENNIKKEEKVNSFRLSKSGPGEASTKTKVITGLVILIGAGCYFWILSGGELSGTKMVDDAKQQVISDSVKEYDIAKRSGTKIEACVHAGLVSASYLQAQDETSYQHWKEIEKTDCSLAGISQ